MENIDFQRSTSDHQIGIAIQSITFLMNTADIDVDSKWNQNDKKNNLTILQLLCQRRPHWVRAKDLPALPSLRTLPPSGGANSSKKKIQDHPCLYFDITFFSSLPLGSRLRHSIAAYQYWNFQFQQPESAYIQVKVQNHTFCFHREFSVFVLNPPWVFDWPVRSAECDSNTDQQWYKRCPYRIQVNKRKG